MYLLSEQSTVSVLPGLLVLLYLLFSNAFSSNKGKRNELIEDEGMIMEIQKNLAKAASFRWEIDGFEIPCSLTEYYFAVLGVGDRFPITIEEVKQAARTKMHAVIESDQQFSSAPDLILAARTHIIYHYEFTAFKN